jgi:hypothetical protein
MPLPGRHSGRSGRTGHESADSGFAWLPCIARAGVVGLCPPGCWASRPCPRPYPLTQARPKQGPLAPAAFAAFTATVSPSDSLSTRWDFALGLYPPPSPDVGRRGGSPQFRIRLSRRALFHTPEASCTSPVPRCSLLPSPWRDRLGHFPFRVLISRGCKVHTLSIGPAGSLPSLAALRLRQGLRRSAQTLGSLLAPGACYAALRRLPRRDSHPLVCCSTSAGLSRLGLVQDAPRRGL